MMRQPVHPGAILPWMAVTPASDGLHLIRISAGTRIQYNATVVPTEYAIKNGAENNKTASWWLRSHGHYSDEASIVTKYGMIDSIRSNKVSCVRPAFWIDLNSEIILK